MISRIKMLYSLLVDKKQKYCNWVNMHIIRLKIKSQKVSNVIEGKNLILIPHADDEWVGCSQIIEKNGMNTILCNLNRQGNDSPDLHNKRYRELEKIANKYNLNIINNASDTDYVNFLVSVLKKNEIDNVFLPFFFDWHEDHISVMRLLYDALIVLEREQLAIYMYQVSVPINKEFITHYCEMGKYRQNSKWKTFCDIYKTQAFFPIDRFKCNERINGKICGTYAAEVYSRLSVKDWMWYYNKLIPNKNERKIIINNFRDIKKIRLLLETCCREVKDDAKQN